MKRILIVDDEIDILDTIVETLEIEFEDKDVSISFSNLPLEALQSFNKDHDFDLVVTDLKMPLMDGLELSKNIKLIKPDIPIIVFTGHGDNQEKLELESLGIDIMVKKPNIKDLVASVCATLKIN